MSTGNAEKCVQCGKCFEVCPLLRATGREEFSPRAKAALATLHGGELEDTPAKSQKLASMCLSCGRCGKLCSQGVNCSEVVANLRAQHKDYKKVLWQLWMGKGQKAWHKASQFATTLQPKKTAEGNPSGSLGMMLKGLAAMDDAHLLPEVAKVQIDSPNTQGTKLLLFSGCVGNTVRQQWREKALHLLHSMGMDVVDPYGRLPKSTFTCCGSTYGSAGLVPEQEKSAVHNVAVWRNAGKPAIIVYCATCQKELQSYCTRDIFQSREEAEMFEKSVIPLAKLLRMARFVLSDSLFSGCKESEKVEKNETGESAKDLISHAHYHRPCHMGAEDNDISVLETMLGEHLDKRNTRECCGFGGIMQVGAPELTAQVSEQCWEFFTGSSSSEGLQLVVTGCSGCALRLRGTAPKGFVAGHWLELIKL
ncbi:MAG: (Fe-S)-binding protein [Desulfovibrio sp.]